jgi:acyl-CoA synthetase (AMP-forming)/AMP-acid ligase II
MTTLAPSSAFSTVFQAFASSAVAHPDADFICVPRRTDRAWSPAGKILSYVQAAYAADLLRDRYATAGYGQGHRVALLLENRPAFLLHFLALNALGVSIVPINPDYRPDEIRYLLEHSEASLIAAIPERVTDLTALAQSLRTPVAVLNGLSLPASIPPPALRTPAGMPPGLEAECALLYTSGTTGRPKGCILSNHYFLTSGACYRDHGGAVAIHHAQDRFYNPLPLFHMNHLALTVTCAMLTANCLVLTERFSPARWWPEVTETRATIVHYLGIVAPMLLNQPPSDAERHHTVRFGLGAGIEPALHTPFENRFGFPMAEVWGMTETGRLFIDCHAPRSVDTRAFGRPYPGLEARVADENGVTVPTGEPGELLVRHSANDPRAGFFSGYLKDEAATEDVWRGGWFHTGDIVTQDASGLLIFIDRRKNIIRRAGENIAAAEVEAVLQSHPAIAQVAVLAVEDETREQEVLAVIVAMPGHQPTAALAYDLFGWCHTRLAYFKAPGWILFRDTLPTTGTQKIQKGQIFAADEDPRQASGIIDMRAMKKR